MAAIEKGLDLSDKASWRKRPERLAEVFGYVNDDNFRRALQRYRRETVKPAICTRLLGSFAIGFFRSFDPPLTRSRH